MKKAAKIRKTRKKVAPAGKMEYNLGQILKSNTEDKMKTIKSKITCGILAASLAASCLTGCGKLDGTQTVATIGDENITLGLASYMARDQQAQAEMYYQMLSMSYGVDVTADGVWDTEEENGKTYGENSKDAVMDSIAGLYAMKAHAADYDVTITEEEQEKIEETAKAFMEANTKKTLEELAVSESDIVTYLELMTYREKMLDPMVADIDREVDEDEINQSKVTLVKVSTKEKDEAGKSVDIPDDEKAKKKELAEKVLEKIADAKDIAEADMAELAKEVDETLYAYSPNFTTAGNENETLDENVKKAALKLKDGELASEPVEGEDGYYVVRLDKKLDEEATEKRKENIITAREDEERDKMLKEWSDEMGMKVDEKVWKKVKITDKKSFLYKIKQPEREEE